MKTDKFDLKKMTKEMIAQKVKSKLEEFYNEDNNKPQEIKQKINTNPKVEIIEEDNESDISEYEEELSPEILKNNNIEKQTELNYFSLNAIGVFIGIALIILFFIIRYFCCCK